MNIRVLGRHWIESMSPLLGERHAFISITDPGASEARLPVCETTAGILRLSFVDLDRHPGPVWEREFGAFDEATLFTYDHAAEIARFAAGLVGTIGTLFVHCTMGMSRSPAVAAAIQKGLLEQDDSAWFRVKSPNMRVYRLTLEACVRLAEAK